MPRTRGVDEHAQLTCALDLARLPALAVGDGYTRVVVARLAHGLRHIECNRGGRVADSVHIQVVAGLCYGKAHLRGLLGVEIRQRLHAGVVRAYHSSAARLENTVT